MDAHRVSEREFQTWVAEGAHRRAAEWLVLRYADEVMGLCTAMVRDRSAAEDLVQDVFGRAFSGLGGYRAEASSRTWLLKIARNRCIDHLRARQREPWGPGDPDAELDPDAQAADEVLPPDLLSRRSDVEAALEQLLEGDRALIVLRFRNGLDYRELALAFGLKEGTVRMRVSRALARMRTALEAREAEVDQALATAPVEASLDEAPGLARFESASGLAAPEAEADFAAAKEEKLAARSRRAAQIPGQAAPPAPAKAAPPHEISMSTVAKRRRSVLGRALDAVFGSAPAAPAPPVEHPLTAFFAATRESLALELRDDLLQRARAI